MDHTSVEHQTSSVERSNIERGAFEPRIGVEPAFDRREDGRGYGKVTGLQCRQHRVFESNVGGSSIPMSSMGRSSRASASSQHLTVDFPEGVRGDGKVTGLQCRALSVRVERRESCRIRSSPDKNYCDRVSTTDFQGPTWLKSPGLGSA
jgi:hypothetical protein